MIHYINTKSFCYLLGVVVLLTAASGASGQISPASDPNTLAKLNSAIVDYYNKQQLDKAISVAEEAIRVAKADFGTDAVELASAHRNLGILQNAKSDRKAAEDSFEKARDIYLRRSNLDNKSLHDFAAMLDALGTLKYQRQMESAESTFELAEKAWIKAAGPDSSESVISLQALANISYWRRDYGKAAERYARVVKLLSRKPANDGDVTLAFHRAQCAFRKADKENEFEAIKNDYEASYDFQKGNVPIPRRQLLESGVINGKALSLVKPRYPAAARQQRASGAVTVEILVGEDGNVVSACAEKTAPQALVASAEAAAYQSKFSPTYVSGSPVRVLGKLVYSFSTR